MISVITLTFNNFEELLETIRTLPANIESVIVNGGSCPQTSVFLSHFFGRHISEKDHGIADAFNKGIRLAKGDAIVFLNSGDKLIDPDYYRVAWEILKANPEISYVYADMIYKDVYAGAILNRAGGTLPNMPFPHPTLIVRRSVFDQIGVFDQTFKSAMDLDFSYRLINAGFEGFYIPRAVVEMDGTGISSMKHWLGYKEKVKAVYKNRDFKFRTLFVLSKDLFKLLVKKALLVLHLEHILGWFRRLKHS